MRTAVKEVDLGDLAARGDLGRRLGEAVRRRGDGVPGREVAPVFGGVDALLVLGLVDHERVAGGIGVVVRVRRRGLDRLGIDAGDGRAGEADDRLGREERRVDGGWRAVSHGAAAPTGAHALLAGGKTSEVVAPALGTAFVAAALACAARRDTSVMASMAASGWSRSWRAGAGPPCPRASRPITARAGERAWYATRIKADATDGEPCAPARTRPADDDCPGPCRSTPPGRSPTPRRRSAHDVTRFPLAAGRRHSKFQTQEHTTHSTCGH
jgi:hypothetical protein